MTSVEPSEGTSTSSDADRMAATESAVNILAQGKRNMVCGEIPTAVNQFQEACKILAKSYGETAKECADAYFCYGQALLDLARMENGVLGNALQGVPDTDEEENSDQKSDQFEKVEMEAEEREKLRQEVYDAMSEKEKADAEAKKSGETMEVAMDTDTSSEAKKSEKTEESAVKEEGKDQKEVNQDEGTSKDKTKEKSKEEEEEKDIDKESKKQDETTSEEKKETTSEEKKEKESTEEAKTGKEEANTEKEEAKTEKEEAKKEKEEAKTEKEKAKTETEEAKTEKSNTEATEKSEGKKSETEAEKEEDKVDKEGTSEKKAAAEKKEDQADDKKTDVKSEGKESEEGEKDGEEKDGEESMEDEEEGEEGTEEEGEDTADDVSQDESQDGENPDDVSNLQLAWEMLELAKLIYSKDDSKEAKLRTAESHLKLGEVSMETEQYEEAIKDFNICLQIQKEYLESDNRLLAETHYQLGLAFCFAKKFTESVESYQSAIKCIESRISKLDEILAKATPEEKESKDFDSPVYKANKEVEDLKELLPDIKSKIDDCEDERKNMDELKNLAKEALGGLAAASTAPSKPEGETPKEEVKTTDISHLIKRKRKSEDNEEDSTKKARQEEGAGDAPPVTNGHAEKETKEAMETKS